MRVRIVPNYSLDNRKVLGMLENIHYYKTPYNRTEITHDKENIFIDLNPKNNISYEIKLTKNDCSFYLGFPDRIKGNVLTELNICYPQATIKEDNKIDIPIGVNKQLELKEHFFMSLKTNMKGQFPLSNLLESQNTLKENEEIYIRFDLEPCNPSWYREVESCIKKFNTNGKVTTKTSLDLRKLTYGGIDFALETCYYGIDLLNSVFSKVEIEHEYLGNDMYSKLLRNGLSDNTLTKSRYNAYKTKINVIIKSEREDMLFRNVLKSFNSMSGDNEFILKDKSHYKNILCSKELAQIMQLPTKYYQETYRINSIDNREIEVPKELQGDRIPVGETTVRGNEVKVSWCNKYNVRALPKVVAGPPGAGKTEYTCNYIKGANKIGDCTITFDYIKNCELTYKSIEDIEDPVLINLADEKQLFAFSYPEVSSNITEESTSWEKILVASEIGQQVKYLVNSISDGDNNGPLSSQMARYLVAAVKIVFIHPDEIVDNVFRVLEEWTVRNNYIRNSKGIYDYDDRVLNTLRELNDVDSNGKITGTKTHLISGIINRINTLVENPRLERMLKAPIDNHDFTEYMNDGRAVFIMMPEKAFKVPMTKDVVVTYFMTRIRMASLERCEVDKPNIAHIITDEVHQVPTAASFFKNHITEFRKFGLSPYFTIHYMKQFKSLLDAIKSAGASYMLIQGIEKENLKMLEEEIKPFTVEEGLNMKPFHSLNIISYGNQYAKFISKLPKPL
ncbi:MAG: hypothetical protein N4A57_02910 [Anaeromicrobium sp.]|jgi:hypothetical protein|uniref:hypothetical protein n=1 Tax=Anaeromicrobium sp. TaxID=1929132 RepID=UPI0025FFF05A|nr:hypothetical protein [Anaeromicrobium sp.]MCT4593212.1 hypothetical protein [Anaeromicrobium sp.]